jgi:hypothetical protein
LSFYSTLARVDKSLTVGKGNSALKIFANVEYFYLTLPQSFSHIGGRINPQTTPTSLRERTGG